MTRRLVSICALLVCATLIADSNVPKANTRSDIKKYVKAAAKYVGKHGPSCKEFEEKDWRAGDYYIFVLGPDDKLICHPNASLVGKPASDIKDANGKVVGSEIAAAGKKRGGGWVEYMWPRPGTDKPVAKTTYATHVKGPDGKTYLVGSGGYEVK